MSRFMRIKIGQEWDVSYQSLNVKNKLSLIGEGLFELKLDMSVKK